MYLFSVIIGLLTLFSYKKRTKRKISRQTWMTVQSKYADTTEDQSAPTRGALDSFSELAGDISSISPSVDCLHSTADTSRVLSTDQDGHCVDSQPHRDYRINQISILGMSSLLKSIYY